MTPDSDNDRNVRDPGDYGSGPTAPPPRGGRERLSSDYDEDAPPRRRPAPAMGNTERAGGVASLLGSDPATRKLVGGAVGIGAVLLLAVGGWSLTGGHHGGIPIIGPPPGPVKDVPADPGGMQIMGSDSGDTDLTGNGEAHLAPGPEQPDAKALARQYGVQPGAPAAPADKPAVTADAQSPDAKPSVGTPPASPDTSADKAPAPADTSKAPVENATPNAEQDDAEPAKAAPEKPVPAPKPKAPEVPVHKAAPVVPAKPVQKPLPPPVPEPENVAPAQKAAATPKAETGGAREVQLAALDSEAAARKEWESLRHQAPALFAGHSPLFEKTAHGDKTFVRLRIGGFEDLKAARAYCVKLHAQSIACTPAQF
ncbi:hypothetical protein BAR24_07920 [Gluconobacter oxydans]|uniref:SPOR domain-containing protein n=1 Tax=Gluconobacter thailandicus TaxID=257438 RepID=UPI00029983F3|nr:SPOR domain-containing protein [Gluconobacter thailandicus]AFV99771.1 hypothetical protein B932_0161 [Gluconobacter oxydans H24]ANQ41391.1 hypothetical protein BAR24_07920 [Gluconobacter oxydans]